MGILLEADGIVFRIVFLNAFGVLFCQHVVHFGMIFGCVLEPWASENHAKVYNCRQFHAFDPLGTESVSESASGRGLGCVFQDFGGDRDILWQLFQPLHLETFFGRHS